MSRYLLIIGVANLVFLVGYITYKETSKEKLAYVDANYLLNNYKGMAKAREDFKKKASVWQANVDTLASEVKKQIGDYQKDAAKSTPKERSLTEELIRTKQRQLEEYKNAMNVKAQQEDEQMTQMVLSEVNAHIKEYGERHGYGLILTATEYGNIAYAGDWLNITEEILSGLNSR